MEHDSRSTPRDAHLEAARRFGERAKASAQWRRNAHRVEALRPAGARPAAAEHRPPTGGGKRGDSRSHA